MRTTFHDVVARFGALRSVSGGLFGHPSTMRASTSDVPVALRLPFIRADAQQAKNQGRFTPTLVKAATLPRPETSPFRRPRAHAPGGPRNKRGTCRRSLDDALNGATRTVTRSLPAISGSSQHARGSAPERGGFVRLFVRPPRRRSEPVAMEGVHPFTPLARPPLAWGLGPVRSCEQRAPHVVAVPPRTRIGKGGFSTTRPRTSAYGDARSLGRCCHRSSDAPVGSQRVEGCFR